jgi:hypothetical protein
MVFTNPIMATHGNRTADQPLMNSMATKGCKSAVHLRGGYGEPIDVTMPSFDHRDGHYVRPNRVALKYLNFKKDIDPSAHVKVFNAKTFEEYIINALNYMLKDTASNRCHSYML